MQTSKKNLWIAGLVLLTALTGSITAARTVTQGPPQAKTQAQIEEERLKALEKMRQELMKNTGAQPQTPPAQAPSSAPSVVQRPPASAKGITLEFDNQDLYTFVTLVTDMLGITPIVIDPDVKGSVTIHSSQPIPMQDVLPLFNVILKSNNAALVKSGSLYKIVPISQGLREGLEVVMHLPPEPPAKPAEQNVPIKKIEPPEAGAKPQEQTAGATALPPDAAAAKTPPAVAAAQGPPAAAVAGQNTPVPASAQPPQQPASPAAPAPSAAQEVPRLATHVIRVEFVPVQSLLEPLKLFMTEGGVIMPYERLNLLILTDYSDSIRKVLEIIHMLDNSFLDADLIELIEIKYNASPDVLADLQKIFGGGKDTATGVYMASLDRINAIMVMANSKRALEEVKRWIDRLDSTTGRSVQTFIYTVENSTASNIAMVLSLLFGGGDSSATSGAQQGAGGGITGVGGGAGTTRSTTGGIGGTGATGGVGGTRSMSSMSSGGFSQGGLAGGSMYGGGTGGYGGGGMYGLGAGMLGGQQNAGGPRLNQSFGMSAQWLNGGQFVGLQGVVRLVADDINNTLIIQASSADYAYLLDTIKRMDVLPRQAIIDARIFEIDLTDDLAYGVAAALQARTAGEHLTTGSISGTSGALNAATFAFVGSAREILLNLDALRQKTKVRILEAPSVLALDGTPARINVGQSVPVPTGSYVPPTGGATTGVTYRDTGTSLLITPRISASGTVTLYIFQEVSSQGAPTPDGPSFNQTNVETTLAVKDGESVAIAGLIRESDGATRNGVPVLSDIPILGVLFGRTTRSTARSELMIMITPHVIRTPERLREMSDEIKDSLRNVRKFIDEKQIEAMQDLEQARRERMESMPKATKPPEPEKPIKKEEAPATEPPVKKDEPPATPPPPIKK